MWPVSTRGARYPRPALMESCPGYMADWEWESGAHNSMRSCEYQRTTTTSTRDPPLRVRVLACQPPAGARVAGAGLHTHTSSGVTDTGMPAPRRTSTTPCSTRLQVTTSPDSASTSTSTPSNPNWRTRASTPNPRREEKVAGAPLSMAPPSPPPGVRACSH
jgi:hypothetical protein